MGSMSTNPCCIVDAILDKTCLLRCRLVSGSLPFISVGFVFDGGTLGNFMSTAQSKRHQELAHLIHSHEMQKSK